MPAGLGSIDDVVKLVTKVGKFSDEAAETARIAEELKNAPKLLESIERFVNEGSGTLEEITRQAKSVEKTNPLISKIMQNADVLRELDVQSKTQSFSRLFKESWKTGQDINLDELAERYSMDESSQTYQAARRLMERREILIREEAARIYRLRVAETGRTTSTKAEELSDYEQARERVIGNIAKRYEGQDVNAAEPVTSAAGAASRADDTTIRPESNRARGAAAGGETLVDDVVETADNTAPVADDAVEAAEATKDTVKTADKVEEAVTTGTKTAKVVPAVTPSGVAIPEFKPKKDWFKFLMRRNFKPWTLFTNLAPLTNMEMRSNPIVRKLYKSVDKVLTGVETGSKTVSESSAAGKVHILQNKILDMVDEGESLESIAEHIDIFAENNKDLLEAARADITAIREYVEENYKAVGTIKEEQSGLKKLFQKLPDSFFPGEHGKLGFEQYQKDTLVFQLKALEDMLDDLKQGTKGRSGKEMLDTVNKLKNKSLKYKDGKVLKVATTDSVSKSLTGLSHANYLLDHAYTRTTGLFRDGTVANQEWIRVADRSVQSGFQNNERHGKLIPINTVRNQNIERVWQNKVMEAYDKFSTKDENGKVIDVNWAGMNAEVFAGYLDTVVESGLDHDGHFMLKSLARRRHAWKGKDIDTMPQTNMLSDALKKHPKYQEGTKDFDPRYKETIDQILTLTESEGGEAGGAAVGRFRGIFEKNRPNAHFYETKAYPFQFSSRYSGAREGFLGGRLAKPGQIFWLNWGGFSPTKRLGAFMLGAKDSKTAVDMGRGNMTTTHTWLRKEPTKLFSKESGAAPVRRVITRWGSGGLINDLAPIPVINKLPDWKGAGSFIRNIARYPRPTKFGILAAVTGAGAYLALRRSEAEKFSDEFSKVEKDLSDEINVYRKEWLEQSVGLRDIVLIQLGDANTNKNIIAAELARLESELERPFTAEDPEYLRLLGDKNTVIPLMTQMDSLIEKIMDDGKDLRKLTEEERENHKKIQTLTEELSVINGKLASALPDAERKELEAQKARDEKDLQEAKDKANPNMQGSFAVRLNLQEEIIKSNQTALQTIVSAYKAYAPDADMVLTIPPIGTAGNTGSPGANPPASDPGVNPRGGAQHAQGGAGGAAGAGNTGGGNNNPAGGGGRENGVIETISSIYDEHDGITGGARKLKNAFLEAVDTGANDPVTHATNDFLGGAGDAAVRGGKYLASTFKHMARPGNKEGQGWLAMGGGLLGALIGQNLIVNKLLDKIGLGKIPLVGTVIKIASFAALFMAARKGTYELIQGTNGSHVDKDIINRTGDDGQGDSQGDGDQAGAQSGGGEAAGPKTLDRIAVKIQNHSGALPELITLSDDEDFDQAFFKDIDFVLDQASGEYVVQIHADNGTSFAPNLIGQSTQGNTLFIPEEVLEKMKGNQPTFEAIDHDADGAMDSFKITVGGEKLIQAAIPSGTTFETLGKGL